MDMSRSSLAILETIEFLSGLSSSELQSIQSHMEELECTGDEPLFNEGDEGDTMYIIIRGSVSISVGVPDGTTVEIAVIPEGNFFGEMSIFDKSVRSATCTPSVGARLLSLSADSFFRFLEDNPIDGTSIMRNMLKTTAMRLKNTGAFLSEMVTWGEQARVRAITDDFTGLYNRRFLDEVFEDRLADAQSRGSTLAVAMIDLDHFGTINNLYGQETGDMILKEAVPVFKKIFREEDVLARYGGDEFTFLLPGTSGAKALELCEDLVSALNEITILKDLDGDIDTVGASIGISCFPDHGNSSKELREAADKALYEIKEAGRNGARLWRRG